MVKKFALDYLVTRIKLRILVIIIDSHLPNSSVKTAQSLINP